MQDNILEVRNLAVSSGKKQILQDINFGIGRNNICSILGPNGSGKSTLLKAILGAINFRGECLIERRACACESVKEVVCGGCGGESKNSDFAPDSPALTNTKTLSARALARLIAYVPQRYNIAFEFSVIDVVLMGLFSRSGFFGYTKAQIALANEALGKMGISHLANERFSVLSGGQKQLVLIARAIIQQSQIIVLDEPVSGLDLGNQHHLLSLLTTLKREKKTIIQTTHYPEHTYNSDQIILLKEGRIYAHGGTEILSRENLKGIYGVETTKVALPNGGYYFCVCD